MNKVILVGNLTKDPELKTTQSNISVCTFGIAVNRKFANAQGVRETDFFNVVAWRNQADFVAKYFTKGKKIGIVGTLQSRTYEAKDGTKRNVVEVVADEIEFVDSRNSQGQENTGSTGGYTQTAKPAATPASEFTGQGFTQVEDDDLPF